MEHRTIYVLPIPESNHLQKKSVNGHRLPSSNATHNADSTTEDESNKKSFCGRIFSCCKFPAFCSKCRKNTSDMDSRPENAKVSRGCLSCCRKTSEDGSVESEPIVADHRRSDASDRSQGHASTNSEQRTCCMKFKDVICCSRKNKVSDLSNRPKGCCAGFSCCRRKSNDENWAERRDSILSDAPPRKCCSGGCWPFCRRKSQDSSTEPDSRRTSMLDKKKSLSPSTIQPPTEKRKPALDESLVEHTSEMRGAIPVLPIPLAWICLILNCILPGVGTILSGIFCLCFGKPRFSVHDGARARLGSFIINLIVGVAQMFCVLFCLVGWGWSIWWGVIMLKVARKHKRTKPIDPDMEENDRVPTATNANHNGPDVERGRS
ncbi:protein stum [Chrysoperla carnea]|uniref:protein stum n=1 Tax=Chrysoperla carnea TaxID=189513 RepID=UPI001D080D9F|nr:protein stum [Chrysoperla carnea]